MNKFLERLFVGIAFLMACLNILMYLPNLFSSIKLGWVLIVNWRLIFDIYFLFVFSPIWEILLGATFGIGIVFALYVYQLWEGGKKTFVKVLASILLIVLIPFVARIADIAQKPFLMKSVDLDSKRFLVTNINDIYWRYALNGLSKIMNISLKLDDRIIEANTEKIIRNEYSNYLTEAQKMKEIKTLVIPNDNIAGIKLGMDKYDVASILGFPDLKIINQMGLDIMIYKVPEIMIGIKDDKVVTVELRNSSKIIILGHEEVEFNRYLTPSELAVLGKPSSVARNYSLEKSFDEATILENKLGIYNYEYAEMGL